MRIGSLPIQCAAAASGGLAEGATRHAFIGGLRFANPPYNYFDLGPFQLISR
jgi:hypothetical protein